MHIPFGIFVKSMIPIRDGKLDLFDLCKFNAKYIDILYNIVLEEQLASARAWLPDDTNCCRQEIPMLNLALTYSTKSF